MSINVSKQAIIVCLTRVINNLCSGSDEIAASKAIITTPGLIDAYLKLPLQLQYPDWYHASMILKNIMQIPSSMRVYTTMLAPTDIILVDNFGVIVTEDGHTTTTGKKIDLLKKYAKEGDEIPWAIDWVLSGDDDVGWTMQVSAVFQRPIIPTNATIH